jgi:probable DNA metabolism protein
MALSAEAEEAIMEARLSGETDLAGFRAEARNLLAHQVPPESVAWSVQPLQAGELLAVPLAPAASRPRNMPKAAGALVPASFLRLCESVALHRDPSRFALMYRLLWRLVHEPRLRTDPIDADMVQAQHMAHAVRRDMHKMKANLRLLAVAPPDEAKPLQLAWYEPSHHIVEAMAPWFARRLGAVRWAILTPERCVCCDSERLFYGPGCEAAKLPQVDEEAQRWLAGYRSVFAGRMAGAV